MKNNFTWGDDVIDSRDIISRHEELQDEYDSLVSALDANKEDLRDFLRDDANDPDNVDEDDESSNYIKSKINDLNSEIEDAIDDLDDFDKDELGLLTEVISQGEDSPDWSYGEGLILDSHFTQYTEELVNDCWDMPKEMNEGKWPWNHLIMDWDAAAEELKNSDYFEITAGGCTYYIRG